MARVVQVEGSAGYTAERVRPTAGRRSNAANTGVYSANAVHYRATLRENRRQDPRTTRTMSKLTKISLTLLSILVVVLLATTLGIYQYVKPFLTYTNLSFSDIKTKVFTARTLRPQFAGKTINLLLLGLDRRQDALEQTVLTDSIIIASLNTATNEVKLIPLPRDLWLDQYKSKINALYYFGEELHGGGISFVSQAISDLTGQPLDYTVLINYLDLVELVDLVDGVDVHLDKGFTDSEYPNPDFIYTPSRDISPFITVTFTPGPNHLDGTRALQFVRSRNSTDTDSGSDTARSSRQMLLFNALIDKITSRRFLTQPDKLAGLYNFWHSKIQSDISDEEILAIGMVLPTDRSIDVTSHAIPSTFDPTGAILVHPPVSRKYANQWVFTPRDPTWTELRSFLSSNFGNPVLPK